MVKRSRVTLSGMVLGLATLGSVPGLGQTAEQRTARYFQSVQPHPGLRQAFLRQMPKGGDLHNHLGGAIYAESMIAFAAQDGSCVERTSQRVLPGPCEPCKAESKIPQASCAFQDPVLYGQLVDAWSMRNWERGMESGHDHFFATFGKFSGAMTRHTGDALAEAASRAAADHLQYVELMQTVDGLQSALLGTKTGWNDDFGEMRKQLLAGKMSEIVAAARQRTDEDEAQKQKVLHCWTSEAQPGCQVTLRYLYQVLRGLPREQVFAQILFGFELARAEHRFVGLNLVMPEDWYVPMRDFDLHMREIEFLRKLYPEVHITLHAGELAVGLVPPEGLRFHIRESIELAGAERIGHGVDVMHERDPLQLLQEMAKKNVLVEICLTSNDVILGVGGKNHPLADYLRARVPVALATDDEGVARSDMTQEFVRAVDEQGLAYPELKKVARASLEHSFLPGASWWAQGKQNQRVAACAAADATKATTSKACQEFLAGSERAQMQWKLEQEFAAFEKQYGAVAP